MTPTCYKLRSNKGKTLNKKGTKKMKNANINLKTEIRYGIISANDVDSDFLADFEPVYSDVFCSNCGEKLSDVYCSECETGNPDFEYHEPIFFEYMGKGITATWNTNTNYITVFKSGAIFQCRLCSPCYPNAGDLSTKGGLKTYGIPKKYLSDTFKRD